LEDDLASSAVSRNHVEGDLASLKSDSALTDGLASHTNFLPQDFGNNAAEDDVEAFDEVISAAVWHK
jgi:hypothetical protein